MRVRDKSEILDSMISNFALDNIPLYEGTITHSILSTVANAIEREYTLKNEEEKAIFIEDGYDEYLDKRVWEFGYDRKLGLPATGQVVFVGRVGTEIKEGTLIKANGLSYRTITGGTIVKAPQTEQTGNGEFIAEIQSDDVGFNTNVKAGTHFECDTISIEDIFNENDIDGGVDTESDENLKARFYATQRNKGVSGNEAHYEQWAKEVAGITESKATGLKYGNGTVEVVVANGDKELDSATIKSVENYIQEQRPVGADVTVKAMDTIDINIVAKINTKLVEIDTIIDEYTERINTYLITCKDNVLYNKVLAHLMMCEGVDDVTTLTVNGKSSNVRLKSTDRARLKSVKLTQIER